MDFWISNWISGFHSGFLDFWISAWISGFQFGFLPTVYEISFVTDPSGCARASRGVSLCLSVLIILLSSQWTEVGIEVVRKEEASGNNE